MRGLRRIVTVGALVLGIHPAMALAVDQTVDVGNDRQLLPADVTVDPGDQVTWCWVGPDVNHSIKALGGQTEFWDSDAGIDPDYEHPLGCDDPKRPGSRTHRFTRSGTFQYHCVLHPAVMQGTVTVRGPVATLTASPASPLTGQQVTFDASGSTDPVGTITGYQWDLDGNPATGPDGFEVNSGKDPHAKATYSDAGAVTVRVRVTDDNAVRPQAGIAFQQITVRSRAPAATFTATPAQAQRGQTVTFDATGTTDPDDAVVRYEWDLDGDQATGPDGFEVSTGPAATVSRAYTQPGTVTVRLRATDAASHSAIATSPLTIVNLAPDAAFTAGSGLTGAAISFDGSSSRDPDGTIARYEWDLDGDGSFERDSAAVPTTTATYGRPGPVEVRLRVTDGDGGVSVATRTVQVGNRAPVAALAISPRAPAPGRTVTFSALGSRDADGRVVRYLWDLDGDGRFEVTSTKGTVTHRYARARTITAKVRIVDDFGATAVASRRVTVGGDRALRVTAPGGQGAQVLRRRALVVSATCSGRCRVVARGRVTISGIPRAAPLTPVTRRLAGGRRGTLRLALPGATRAALARALDHGRRAIAAVTVTGTDAGGRRHVATVRITLRR